MLDELMIKDFALIESLSVSFDKGLNILTGETGAGKSIIVGALSFLLGGKTETDSIRSGCDEAIVSAVLHFDPSNAEIREWLRLRDIIAEDNSLVIRRNLKQSGRGTAYIQSVPVSRADLAEFTAFLFDIHGQHDHQALLRRETHRRYLDRFAGIEEEVDLFHARFIDLMEKKQVLKNSFESEKDREERIELLRYSIEEINKVAPIPGESQALEEEATLLGDYEKLTEMVNNACTYLFDSDPSSLSLFRKAKTFLESATTIDSKTQAISSRLNDLYYEAEDTAEQLRTYRDGLQYDPERLEYIEDRLAQLYKLKKKYGEDEGQILAYRQKAESEIEKLEKTVENRASLESELKILEKELLNYAAIITMKRMEASRMLGDRITEIIGSLGMPKSKFSVSIVSKGQGSVGMLLGPWGAEDVEFMISANLGEPVKELSKIASGGELSRVMLAIKTVLAKADMVETLVFDEIDTGIGGEVALAVGEHLSKIGAFKQIFCITHLASIAVRADNHLKVEKKVEDARTVTALSVLSKNAQREEIARMLAGDSAGNAALAHADELIRKFGMRG